MRPPACRAPSCGARRLVLLGLTLFVAGAGAGCGGGDAGAKLVHGVTVEVDARDNVFDPETVEVAAGTNVRFVNVGRNDHNVVPVSDDQGDLRVRTSQLGPDEKAVVRLTEPGTYRYYCSIHGTPRAGMTGVIKVTG